jgi:hypothetical protein
MMYVPHIGIDIAIFDCDQAQAQSSEGSRSLAMFSPHKAMALVQGPAS